eukprot:jgi/Galph1/980/GphlegSOOS_G5715.1
MKLGKLKYESPIKDLHTQSCFTGQKRRRLNMSRSFPYSKGSNHVLLRLPVEEDPYSKGSSSSLFFDGMPETNVLEPNNSEPQKLHENISDGTFEYFIKRNNSLRRIEHETKPPQTTVCPQEKSMVFQKKYLNNSRKPLSKKSTKSGCSNNLVYRRIITREWPNEKSWTCRSQVTCNSCNLHLKPNKSSPHQETETCLLKSKNRTLNAEPCLFYSRFGLCKNRSCTYAHDRDKVSICRKFISGTCTGSNCNLLHSLDKNKMPVCLKFLGGLCANEDCPYLHVNVGRKAEVCSDFSLKGFCALGASCNKVHTWDCLDFWRSGKCQHRDKCHLRHKLCYYRGKSLG